MSRVYREPVDVWTREGSPVRFAWRGRTYTVLRVLDRWVISREWWKRREAGPGGATEHEFWRVEAVAARNASPATYELRLDVGAGSWLLARVWD